MFAKRGAQQLAIRGATAISGRRAFSLARAVADRRQEFSALTTTTRVFPTAMRHMSSSAPAYENIIVTTQGKVGLITLNRPKALNALNSALIAELGAAIRAFDKNSDVSVVVLTGSDKAFAAGADIKEMKDKSFMECFKQDFISNWGDIAKSRKPVIAAVNGFALGGGCEVAMMCDIIYCGDNAVFGQPEITIGTIPGGGGTQRLIREIGKSRSMEMILSGEQISAPEALRLGLVSKVFAPEETLPAALKLAQKIARYSQPSLITAKEAVNNAYDMGLQQGLKAEIRAFWSTFATADQKEGMGAFAEKRKPEFKDE